MNSSAYIDLALKILKLNQKELAKVLDVSPTQISKWKKANIFLSTCKKNLDNF